MSHREQAGLLLILLLFVVIARMYFTKICEISKQNLRFSTGIYIAYLKGDPPTSGLLSLNSPGYEMSFFQDLKTCMGDSPSCV